MPESKTNILIIGAGKGGKLLIELFYNSGTVNIQGVVDTNADAPGMQLARELGIPTATNYREFLDHEELDEIINVTASESVQEDLLSRKPLHVEVIGGHSAKLIWDLIEERRSMEDALSWELKVNAAIAELSSAILVEQSFSIDDISHIVSEHARRLTDSPFGYVGYIDPNTRCLVSTTLTRDIWEKCNVADKKIIFEKFSGLWGWVLDNKKPLLTNDPATDERFKGLKWDQTINSVLCVPLMVKSELKGVLTAYNKKGGGGFSEDDQRLLAIIAMQSAQVIENARLYEEQEAYMRMQEEVRLASRIQLDLLPKEPPAIPGYDIAGRSIPAQMVGGDYFDFIPMEQNHMAICLGDVSGKGLPASLLMANLQATLRGQSLHPIRVNERVERANRLLYRSTDPEKFATLFYGVLGLDDNKLTFSNAGHENPYLFSGGNETKRLSTGGTVLGVVDNFPYDEEVVQFDQGDVLVIFSDGITEAFDKEDTDQFGEERLDRFLRAFYERFAGTRQATTELFLESAKTHLGSEAENFFRQELYRKASVTADDD